MRLTSKQALTLPLFLLVSLLFILSVSATEVQKYDSGAANLGFWGSTYANYRHSMSFLANTTATIETINLQLAKSNAVNTQSFDVYLYRSNGTAPTTELAHFGEYTHNSLKPNTCAYPDCTFNATNATGVNITSGNYYAILLDEQGVPAVDKRYQWKCDGNNPVQTNPYLGTFRYDIAGVWNPDGWVADCAFTLYGTPLIATGYIINVKDFYDNTNLAGVNVTFAPGCTNLTDASGNAQSDNSKPGCAGLSGTLTAVNLSFSSYNWNETSYTLVQNQTTMAGGWQRKINITANDTFFSSYFNSSYNITTGGGLTYADGLNVYALNDSDNYTFSAVGWYDTTAVLSVTETIITNLTNTFISFVGVSSAVDYSSTITCSVDGSTIKKVSDNYYGFPPATTEISCSAADTYPSFSENITTINGLTKNTTINITEFSGTFTFHDQETGDLLNDTTVFLELIGDDFSANYTTTNGTVQAGVLTLGNITLRYNALGYQNTFYLIEVADGAAANDYDLNLTLLNTTGATDLEINVIDSLGNDVEGAIVKIQRYDVITNSYITVEILTTNFEGITHASVTQDEYYKFIVEYNGGVVFSSIPSYIYGTSITLKVSIDTQGLEEYFSDVSITGNVVFSNATNTATFTFNDANNEATQGCVYAYKVTGSAKTLYNSSCAVTPSGSTAITVANESGTTYFIDGYVTLDGEDLLQDSTTVQYDTPMPDTEGLGIFLLIFLEIVFFFIGFWSLPAAVLLMTAAPLLVGITGIVAIPLKITIPIFALGIFVAYVIRRGQT